MRRSPCEPSPGPEAAASCSPFLLVCACSLAISAAGCASAAAFKDSQAPLAITPAAVDFKSVVVGQKNSQTVTVSNSGGSAVDLRSVHVSGSGFQLASGKLPATLPPGGKARFTVSFAPAAPAAADGTLVLYSSGSKHPLKVVLSGSGQKAEPGLLASPASVRFGTRATGSANFETVSLRNTGNVGLKVQSVSVGNTAFSVSGFAPGASLAPGQQLNVQVCFRPTGSGSWSSSISVAASSIASPVTLPVSGAASASTVAAPSAASHSVALDWNASSSAVAGYHVYRGFSAGGPYNRLNGSLVTALGYSDSTVAGGAQYFYVVTAVESDGAESAFSNEVSADIPN